MWGLLHDAPEAYLQDIARPVKQYLYEYVQMEGRVMKVIADKFELEGIMPEEVRAVDDQVLMAEAKQLMRGDITEWYTVATPAKVQIIPLPPAAAEKFFLYRYFEILDGVEEQEWTWKDYDQE